MTTKHTPGPWKTWPALSLADCADHIRICAGIESVAKVGSIDHPWTQTAADARLIAAAPELLAAVESALAIQELWLIVDCKEEHESEAAALSIMKQRFESVIAKVTK